MTVFAHGTRRQLAAADWDLVVVPLGATEQHGDHLPVSTDAVVAAELAERVCRLLAPEVRTLLAPVLPFGMSQHHLPFGGTISLTPSTYVPVLVDVVRGLWRQGYSRVFFLNGHGGNAASMAVAIETLADDVGARSVAGMSYWDVPGSGGGAAVAPGHAGAFETALLRAIEPEGVDLGMAARVEEPTPLVANDVPGLRYARIADWIASDGVTDDASDASAEFGAQALDRIADGLAAVVRRYVAATAADSDGGSSAWS